MTIIGQMLQAIWAGMKVGFQAFFSMIPIYQQLSDFKTQLIAAAIGVPVIVLTIGGIVIKVIKFLWSRI